MVKNVNFYKILKKIIGNDEGQFDYHEFFQKWKNGIFHFQLLKHKIVTLTLTP